VTRTSDTAPEPAQPRTGDLEAEEIYREICAGIRATDDISLKLLAAVPIATGVGIALLVRVPSEDLPEPVRPFLSLFAAVVTFAIYRWERKNIAICTHFRAWANVLERDHFRLQLPDSEKPALMSLPHGTVSAPRFLTLSWGKTQAEILLYWTVILTWLSVSVYTLVA
jgi:hypothetical protein